MTVTPYREPVSQPQLSDLVPMVRTLGIEVIDATAERAHAVLPDDPRWHNHIGGPHVGAMFTLAESASGALVLAAAGDLLDRCTPLARTARMEFLAKALGEVSAVATADPDEVAAARAAVDAPDGRPRFTVVVELSAAGETTGRLSIDWVLFRHA
jgi:uncharacterized protein (TIGR00369 family)